VEVSFEQWTGGRELPSFGTNAGADVLPFQRWRHFKEAFTPELVARAVSEADLKVTRSLDPFGGSGTTALASQFLGIAPTTAEVNPFLADLIEAKLVTYNVDSLIRHLAEVAAAAARLKVSSKTFFAHLPSSFVEPGREGRWLFDRPVADKIASLLTAIDAVPSRTNRRLFKVLMGGVLIEVSNAVINGKGRRYRKNWRERPRNVMDVEHLFFASVRNAIGDIHRFSKRKSSEFKVIRGDCRKKLAAIDKVDVAILSPPYPNSFDYTDVYNIELWMLGYLKDFVANRKLRTATLSSHVQVGRRFAAAPDQSQRLNRVIKQLTRARGDLWDHRIPEMVGGYFADMQSVLNSINKKLRMRGKAWVVVGDSRYAGVHIPTAHIIAELACAGKWCVDGIEPFRSMRVSSQQGGQPALKETLLILQKTSGAA